MSRPEVRSYFGDNLRELILQKGTVASVARDLDLNRTQINRYLRGESFPRPDILAKICDYFGTDARIYTEPLDHLTEAVKLPSGQTLPQPTTDTLPDGIYVEWTVWPSAGDAFFKHLLMIKRVDNLCAVRVYGRAPDALLSAPNKRITVRERDKLQQCHGFAFMQGTAIATLDGLKNGTIVALTTYQVGHIGNLNILLGYKLTGSNYQRGMVHCHVPCVLQKIPQTSHDVLSWARKPQLYKFAELDEIVRSGFHRLQRDNSMLPSMET